MSRNRLGTRRALRFAPSSRGVLLPLVGSFQLMSRPLAASLPDFDFTVDTQLSGAGTTDGNPLKGNNITLEAGVKLTSSTYSVNLWAKTLTLMSGSLISTSGDNGGDSLNGCCGAVGGNGGNGASGGGGGSAQMIGSCTGLNGGAGGDGTAGQDGSTDAGGTFGMGGFGGGHGVVSAYPSLTYGSFTYNLGGSTSITPTGPWGYGGAGGGTQCFPAPFASPGGGAGAGHQMLVCNELIGVPAFGAGVVAAGGNAGMNGCLGGSSAENGGNGNIYIFTQKYSANTIGAFGFNHIYMFEVAHDGVTILNTFIDDTGHTWNHL